MNEKMLDVLMYLFESYMDENPDIEPDHKFLESELHQAGFLKRDINKAFNWLEGLSDMAASKDEADICQPSSTRCFSSQELLKIDERGQGMLLSLEQRGVLDGRTRELVIDRITALDVNQVDEDQLRWVVLMVLFNQSNMEQVRYEDLENMVFSDDSNYLH